MIVLKLTDGLGNQMFQYAYGRYLQILYNEKNLYLDITKLGKNHVREYGLHYFLLNQNVIIPSKFIQYLCRVYVKVLLNLLYRVLRIPTATQKGVNVFSRCGLYTNSSYYEYFDFVKTPLPIKFCRGFFQNEKYFKSILPVIKNEFIISPLKLSEEQLHLIRQINDSESVCIHVRRGDYVGKKRFEVCGKKYYERGMNRILSIIPDAKFFLFSNSKQDVEWVRNQYKLEGDIIYVDLGNNEIEDFYTMSLCKHFIISNSTYSWWAAYLSQNSNKVVVAPKPWVNSSIYQDGIYCEGWHIINVA